MRGAVGLGRGDAFEERVVVVELRPRPLVDPEVVEARPAERRAVGLEPFREGLVTAPDLADVERIEELRRFDDLGARLAAGIQERVLRSLEGKADQTVRGSAVDDIATRMESLGAEIDARVQAALAKKGIPPRP